MKLGDVFRVRDVSLEPWLKNIAEVFGLEAGASDDAELRRRILDKIGSMKAAPGSTAHLDFQVTNCIADNMPLVSSVEQCKAQLARRWLRQERDPLSRWQRTKWWLQLWRQR